MHATLPPPPANPELKGVFFDSDKRVGYWKAIVVIGERVQYQKIPGTDVYTTRTTAEYLASQIEWTLI